jgi:hypothetical protein
MRNEIINELEHVWNDVEGQVDIKYEIKYLWSKEVIDGSR